MKTGAYLLRFCEGNLRDCWGRHLRSCQHFCQSDPGDRVLFFYASQCPYLCHQQHQEKEKTGCSRPHQFTYKKETCTVLYKNVGGERNAVFIINEGKPLLSDDNHWCNLFFQHGGCHSCFCWFLSSWYISSIHTCFAGCWGGKELLYSIQKLRWISFCA